MNEARTHEVTAFYDDRAQAQRALERLNAAGLSIENARLVEGNDPAANAGTRPDDDRGFLDKLGDFFMPEEDRYTYAEGLHRGGYVVSARVAAEHHDRVADILDDEHGVDLDQRSSEWQSEGWAGYRAEGAAAAGAGAGGTIEVAEEQLKVGKRDVSHGRVKVRSYVVEDQVSEDVTLRSEEVDVERRPVDRVVDNADAAFRERTVEVEESAEEAVVAKEAHVVEEIDVSKRVETGVETVTDTVRRTEVEVDDERTGKRR